MGLSGSICRRPKYSDSQLGPTGAVKTQVDMTLLPAQSLAAWESLQPAVFSRAWISCGYTTIDMHTEENMPRAVVSETGLQVLAGLRLGDDEYLLRGQEKYARAL